jgi:predicted acyltransferase
MVKTAQRSMALDVFRGIAIAGMLLVNNPGSWSHVYPPLLHARWHGCTPTDLVFPFFMVAVGAAMYFSFSLKDARPTRPVLLSVFRRSALLVFIGVALNVFPFTDPISEWRLPGVLQRIGLAYAVAALLVLYLPHKARLGVSLVLLLGYWGLLAALGGPEPYAVESNLVRRIDLALLGESHLYTGFGLPFDPEGLLSTLPAVVSIMAGFEAARIMRRVAAPARAATWLGLGGVVMIVAGLVWNPVFPINKPLWTSSYVLYTSGIAWVTLAVLTLLLDALGWRSLGKPLQIYGSNPLFIYVLAGLTARLLWMIPVDDATLKTWLWQQLQPALSPINASLLFAVLFVGVFWILSWALYRKNIFIRL